MRCGLGDRDTAEKQAKSCLHGVDSLVGVRDSSNRVIKRSYEMLGNQE